MFRDSHRRILKNKKIKTSLNKQFFDIIGKKIERIITMRGHCFNILIYKAEHEERKKKSLRAFPFGIPKKFYFTISKPTLFILPYHFTIYPPSDFLFL